jgi:hypothetical protein
MKLSKGLSTIKVVFFASVLLATCLSARSANAQSVAFRGTFTLTEETHWGQAVLRAGDYELSIVSTGLPSMVVIRDAASGSKVATLFPRVRELSATGENELLLGTQGRRRVIYSLRLPELGMAFISDPALARGAENEGAGKKQVVPVIVAAK